ncbi:hypothetical protein TNCV_4799641 [Trichonephila clavipes]|uniref:Uncharacterized protein n=1 Tax=Trichonephila clavipes TaxID=2585209 RepID=A0A8X6RL72_TRICX|nr:hypothetical protein TNCV_4799641 [Trichonephila clavipes]
MLAKGERAYSLVDERQRGKRRLRQGEKLNFRCRKARETRPLCMEAEREQKRRSGDQYREHVKSIEKSCVCKYQERNVRSDVSVRKTSDIGALCSTVE